MTVEAAAQRRSDAAAGHSPAARLSVIITCHNYEAFVGQAIDSVLGQDVPCLEVIVVDDASTDGSWERIRSFGDRVHAIRTGHQGPLRASLAGLAVATGDFVYFLDADDVLCDGTLKVLAPHLRQGVSKVQFKLLPIDRHGDVIGPPFPDVRDTSTSASLIASIARRGYYSTPPTSGNVYHRSVFQDLGDLSYERAIDGIPYLLAPFLGEVVSIGRPLAKYRIHGANLSGFANPTADRLDGYAGRFRARLHHLDALLRRRGLEHRGFKLRDGYSYLHEMNILRTVAARGRIGPSLLWSYAAALRRERRGAASVVLPLCYLVFALVPKRTAITLLGIRLNQARWTGVRTRLKQVSSRL